MSRRGRGEKYERDKSKGVGLGPCTRWLVSTDNGTRAISFLQIAFNDLTLSKVEITCWKSRAQKLFVLRVQNFPKLHSSVALLVPAM